MDNMWVSGATGIEERDHDCRVGFDDLTTAEAAAAALPANLTWTITPVAPLSSWDTYATVTHHDQFVIRPPWLNLDGPDSPVSPTTGHIELIIDPGTTFGHGGHPTTQLALEALRTHLRPDDSVLDVGCGSGVLAIAAAKLGATTIRAIDIDLEAVKQTQLNAAANGLAPEAIEASATRLHDLASTFDIVVANMARPVLLEHLDELRTCTNRVLILTGMLATDPLPFQENSLQLGDWGCHVLTIRPRPSHPRPAGGDIDTA